MENVNSKPTDTSIQIDKNTAVIAYITIIGLIVAFIMNKDKKEEFTSYHIRQSLGLAIVGLALGILSMIPVLGMIIYILGGFILLYMWIVGLTNAINSKKGPVPFLGEKFNDWFKKV